MYCWLTVQLTLSRSYEPQNDNNFWNSPQVKLLYYILGVAEGLRVGCVKVTVIAKYCDLSLSRRSIICLSLRLRQIIDLLATDKSRYFAQPRPIVVLFPAQNGQLAYFHSCGWKLQYSSDLKMVLIFLVTKVFQKGTMFK